MLFSAQATHHLGARFCTEAGTRRASDGMTVVFCRRVARAKKRAAPFASPRDADLIPDGGDGGDEGYDRWKLLATPSAESCCECLHRVLFLSFSLSSHHPPESASFPHISRKLLLLLLTAVNISAQTNYRPTRDQQLTRAQPSHPCVPKSLPPSRLVQQA